MLARRANSLWRLSARAHAVHPVSTSRHLAYEASEDDTELPSRRLASIATLGSRWHGLTGW